MVNGDRNRKLLVRSAFVTGSTIAILIGAQNLATLDARQFTETTPESNNVDTTESATLLSNPPTIAEQHSPEIIVTIVQAAPSITILRQAGNPIAVSNNAEQAVIQPPVASLMATPAPLVVQSQSQPQVIVQQSNQQSNQSTRTSK